MLNDDIKLGLNWKQHKNAERERDYLKLHVVFISYSKSRYFRIFSNPIYCIVQNLFFVISPNNQQIKLKLFSILYQISILEFSFRFLFFPLTYFFLKHFLTSLISFLRFDFQFFVVEKRCLICKWNQNKNPFSKLMSFQSSMSTQPLRIRIWNETVFENLIFSLPKPVLNHDFKRTNSNCARSRKSRNYANKMRIVSRTFSLPLLINWMKSRAVKQPHRNKHKHTESSFCPLSKKCFKIFSQKTRRNLANKTEIIRWNLVLTASFKLHRIFNWTHRKKIRTRSNIDWKSKN